MRFNASVEQGSPGLGIHPIVKQLCRLQRYITNKVFHFITRLPKQLLLFIV